MKILLPIVVLGENSINFSNIDVTAHFIFGKKGCTVFTITRKGEIFDILEGGNLDIDFSPSFIETCDAVEVFFEEEEAKDFLAKLLKE